MVPRVLGQEMEAQFLETAEKLGLNSVIELSNLPRILLVQALSSPAARHRSTARSAAFSRLRAASSAWTQGKLSNFEILN